MAPCGRRMHREQFKAEAEVKLILDSGNIQGDLVASKCCGSGFLLARIPLGIFRRAPAAGPLELSHFG